MISRHPVMDIIPMWSQVVGDRYVSHPALRTAIIQLLDDPGHVYAIADEMLPDSIVSARKIVARWRETNETAPL